MVVCSIELVHWSSRWFSPTIGIGNAAPRGRIFTLENLPRTAPVGNQMIASILSAALVFAVLVVVHEAGHFAMAKKVGVRVLRFSIGYPPKLFGFRRGETEYSVGATPFGGYVRMLGDEVGEKPTPDEIKLYLHEIGLDLIGAARERSVIHADSPFEDNLRVIADRLGESGAGVAHAIIGRELKPDEALLLEEVRREPKP